MADLQVLTLAGVRAAARKYFKARKLTAQHRDPKKRLCKYKIGAYRCSIGAALSDKTLRLMKGKADGGREYANGNCCGMDEYFRIDPKCLSLISQIQSAHDSWCNQAARADPDDKRMVVLLRNRFKQLIGL